MQTKPYMVRIMMPIAVIHDAKGIIKRVRVVLCKVETTEPACDENNAMLRACSVNFINIARIVTTHVYEVPLKGDTKYKVIRERLFLQWYPDSLFGVKAITYECEDTGAVRNAGVYYPLISRQRRDNEMSQQPPRENICIHGYWDYMGKWHVGTEGIPNSEPYSRELQYLANGYFNEALSVVPDEKIPMDGAETFLPAWSLTQQGLVHTKLAIYIREEHGRQELVQPWLQAMMTPDSISCNLNGTLPQEYVALPTSVRVLQLSSTLKQPVTVQLPQGLSKLKVDTNARVQLLGLEQAHLNLYEYTYGDIARMQLPKEISSSVTGAPGKLCIRPHTVGKFHVDSLNLYTVCSDMFSIEIAVPGQPWDKVLLPTAHVEHSYTGIITRPQFSLAMADTRVQREKQIFPRGARAILCFANNDVAKKVVNIDARRMKHFEGIIGVQAELQTTCMVGADALADGYNGSNNVVNVYLRPTEVAYGWGNTLVYETNCTVTDNIVTETPLQSLRLIVQKTRVSTGAAMQAGITRLTGDIDELLIAVEACDGEFAVKDVYIYGAVKTLRVQILGCTDAEQAKVYVSRVRLHFARNAVLPTISWSRIEVSNHVIYTWTKKLTTLKDYRTGPFLRGTVVREQISKDA